MNINFFDMVESVRNVRMSKILIKCVICQSSFASYFPWHETIDIFHFYDKPTNSQSSIEYSCPYCNNIYHKTSDWIYEQ